MASRIELEHRLTNRRHFPLVMSAAVAMLLAFSLVGVSFFGADLLGLSQESQGATASDYRVRVGVWGMMALPWLVLPGLFLMRRKRIILDDRGVHVFRRWPRFLAWASADASIPWSELHAISWKFAREHPLASQLVLQVKSGARTIMPWQWIAHASTMAPLFVRDAREPEVARRLLNASPIVQALKARRPDLRPELPADCANSAKPPSAANTTPATLAVASAFMALVVYFIADIYFAATEYYAEGAPLGWLVMLALIAGALALIVLKRAEPARKDAWVYGLLFGLGVGLAAHPFLARVNTWTDRGGLQTYEYRLDTDLVWRSQSGPDLALYMSASEWWRQFQPGDTYTFELRKGGLGLWQVNMTPIYDAQKEFYRRKAGSR